MPSKPHDKGNEQVRKNRQMVKKERKKVLSLIQLLIFQDHLLRCIRGWKSYCKDPCVCVRVHLQVHI